MVLIILANNHQGLKKCLTEKFCKVIKMSQIPGKAVSDAHCIISTGCLEMPQPPPLTYIAACKVY